MVRALHTLVLLSIVTATVALAGNVEDEIRSAESAWAAAVKARDFAALDKIFASGLIYAHSTGIIENKQQYLDRLKSGAQRYETITHENTRIVGYGDSAVAHSTVRMAGLSNGKPFNDHVMMLHSWVKQGGAWRIAAHQTTKIP